MRFFAFFFFFYIKILSIIIKKRGNINFNEISTFFDKEWEVYHERTCETLPSNEKVCRMLVVPLP